MTESISGDISSFRDGRANRLAAVGSVGLLLLVYMGLERVEWVGNSQRHTIMEVVATLMALIVGILALIRYYAQRRDMVLMLGVGFIGTAVLDGYHAFVTSPAFAQYFPSPEITLLPWSWNASRTFLALSMLASWVAWQSESVRGEANRLSPDAIYAGALTAVLMTFCFFAFVPLGPAYFPDAVLGRPQEMIPAGLLLAALIGFASTKHTLDQPLEHWMIFSMLTGLVCQAVFMSRSTALFDDMFDMAHILKIVSYGVAFVGFSTDISMTWRRTEHLTEELRSVNHHLERRVAERTAQLEIANRALEDSNLELQQFAYVASHDLQTPLRSMAGFAQVLEADYAPQLDSTARSHVARIVQACERMHTLVADILTFSRVEARACKFEPADLNQIVAQTAAMLEDEIQISNAEITYEELPTIAGDPAQLSQLLNNLIGNALKYQTTDTPKIHISAERRGQEWIISVRDNGIGIDAKHQDKIFEIFKRLHSQENYPGTGIGLAICKRIVDRHGGRIWLDSGPGAGSTFRFSLPNHDRDTSVTRPHGAAAEPSPEVETDPTQNGMPSC